MHLEKLNEINDERGKQDNFLQMEQQEKKMKRMMMMMMMKRKRKEKQEEMDEKERKHQYLQVSLDPFSPLYDNIYGQNEHQFEQTFAKKN